MGEFPTRPNDSIGGRNYNGAPKHTHSRSMGEFPTLPNDSPYGEKSKAADIPAVFSVGDRIAGRFVIEEVLGEGGMGVVYKVFDERFPQCVRALKTIAPSRLASDIARKRFMIEAELAHKLDHPNIVATHGFYEIHVERLSKSVPFITMDYLHGHSLAEELRERGRLPLEVAVKVISQLLEALRYAHQFLDTDGVEKEILHRDVKPENMFLCDSDDEDHRFETVQLIDFGLARVSESETLTQIHAVAGTINYIAPERLLGEKATVQSDLYSVGVVFFKCLTGEFPHGVDSLDNHNVESPKRVNRLLTMLLQRRPEDRPKSAEEALEILSGNRRQVSTSSRRGLGSFSKSTLVTLLAVLILVFAIIVFREVILVH